MSRKFFSVIAIAILMGLPNYSFAKVIVKERFSFYTIAGKTGADLNISMLKRGGKKTQLAHAIASTESNLNVKNIKFAIKGGRCVIESADIILDLKYTLPKWKKPKTVSKSLNSGWEKFYALLLRHEKKHGDISKDAARSIERELKRLRGSVSKKCADFGNTAKSKFSRVGRTLAARQRRFDRLEGSGFSTIVRTQRKLHTLK